LGKIESSNRLSIRVDRKFKNIQIS
jgi:hypothetical protein